MVHKLGLQQECQLTAHRRDRAGPCTPAALSEGHTPLGEGAMTPLHCTMMDICPSTLHGRYAWERASAPGAACSGPCAAAVTARRGSNTPGWTGWGSTRPRGRRHAPAPAAQAAPAAHHHTCSANAPLNALRSSSNDSVSTFRCTTMVQTAPCTMCNALGQCTPTAVRSGAQLT